MSYDAVLFDMDGVIADSEPLHLAAFRATLRNYGHELTDEHYKQHFVGKTDEAGFRQYLAFVNEAHDVPAIISEKAKAYMELAIDQLVPYPGVPAIIRQLHAQGTKLGLVTGSFRAEVDVVFKAFEIGDCFGAVVPAEDITESKPSPQGYLKAAKLLGVDPSQCIVIEDAPSGVQAAAVGGMRCLAITNTHEASELSAATVVVDQLTLAVIDELGKKENI